MDFKTRIAAVLLGASFACLPACAEPDLYYRHQDAGGVPTEPVTTGGAGQSVFMGGDGAAGAGGASGGAGTSGSGGAAGAADASGTAGGAAGGGVTGAAGSPLPSIDARLTDDFEDGSTQGWIADTVDGDWAIVAEGTGKVYEQQRMDSNLSLAIGGKITWTDQVVATKVKMISFSSSSAIVDLAVRYEDKDNYDFASLKADGSLKIRKRVGGSTTDVASYKSGTPIVKDTWYTLGLSAVGTTLTATLNGMMVATGTSTDLPSGGIALGVQNAVAAFDDVMVTPP